MTVTGHSKLAGHDGTTLRHLCCLLRGQDIGSVVLVFALTHRTVSVPSIRLRVIFVKFFHSVTKQTGIRSKLPGHLLSDFRLVVLGAPFIKLHWFVP